MTEELNVYFNFTQLKFEFKYMWLGVIIWDNEVLDNLSCTNDGKKALNFINGAK